VLGFYLPGEMLGLDAIHSGHYPCHAVALDTVSLCSAPFPSIAALARRERTLQARLFRLLSHDIRKASALVGDHTADERVAAFLWALWQHQTEINPAATQLELVMSRTDIANYLRLASETVSRVFQRLQQIGILRVNRRRVELCDLPRLEALANAILKSSA
jgi:CRP/FNR family transcriptional regulator